MATRRHRFFGVPEVGFAAWVHLLNVFYLVQTAHWHT